MCYVVFRYDHKNVCDNYNTLVKIKHKKDVILYLYRKYIIK